MTRLVLNAALLGLFAIPPSSQAVDAQRQADVAKRSADLMPFELKATTHVFTKTPAGGIQRVVAKDPAVSKQVALGRTHLRDIRARFLRRASKEFSWNSSRYCSWRSAAASPRSRSPRSSASH